MDGGFALPICRLLASIVDMSAVRRHIPVQVDWENRWGRYAAASLAAGISASAATGTEITFSDVTYTLSGATVGSSNPYYEIDLDGDSVADFSFLYDPPSAGSSVTELIPNPFGSGSSSFISVTLPASAQLPGKILISAINPEAYILGQSYSSSSPMSTPMPNIFQSGYSDTFFVSYSIGSGASTFSFVGDGMLKTKLIAGREDAFGVLEDNGVAAAGESPSFFGLVVKNSELGPTAGFVGVNRRYDELVINFWGTVDDPTAAFVYASPVPETGTVGGLAALALGAVGLREWRKRRRRVEEADASDDSISG